MPGLLTGLLPTPQGLPPNITPSQGGISHFGGNIMQNLPYGGGFLYDAINSLVHAGQGTLGQHGPAPDLIGRIAQYINPGYTQGGGGLLPSQAGANYPFYGNQSLLPGETGLPGGGAVGGIDPTTGQPVYQPLGTLPPQSMTGPYLPTNTETNNPPMYGAPSGGSQTGGGGTGGGAFASALGGIPLGSYLQGTSNGYGGGSELQLLGALRDYLG